MTTDLKTLDVAVLCGGPGAEREVSLQSGANVHAALLAEGFRARKIELPADGAPDALRESRMDAAVLMLHGEFGEDGDAQDILQGMGIPFTGSDGETCRVAIDKNATKERMRQAGIPTPRWIVARSEDEGVRLWRASGIGLPVVVKPNSRGSSVGTTVVRAEEEMAPAFALALRFDDRALAEAYVAGREATVGWLDGVALPVIELAADGEFYDYRAKYVSDKTRYLCPAPFSGEETRELQRLAARVCEILSVRDLARADIMVGADGPQVLEVNTAPGFTSHSLLPKAAAAAGISFGRLCARLVEMAWRRSS